MITSPIRVGTFACPEGAGRVPGVLALGGSNGGVPEMYSRLLAPEGFACLALEYFGSPYTQPGLTEVLLERIERGLRWRLDHPSVAHSDGRVGVLGGGDDGMWPGGADVRHGSRANEGTRPRT